jgi:hypothetical protein
MKYPQRHSKKTKIHRGYGDLLAVEAIQLKAKFAKQI